jgi:hypothetical protein
MDPKILGLPRRACARLVPAMAARRAHRNPPAAVGRAGDQGFTTEESRREFLFRRTEDLRTQIQEGVDEICRENPPLRLA